MNKNHPSQTKPMVIWCLLVGTLVAIVIAIGVVLFFTPAQGNSPIKSAAPPSAGKSSHN